MAQDTVVVQLGPKEQERFRGRLEAGDFEYREVNHARFSARGEGVVATLYLSGKLVVQGAGVDVFAARYLEADFDEDKGPGGSGRAETDQERPGKNPAKNPAKNPDPAGVPSTAIIGSDETGKGDYFGPLVVVALRLEPADHADLAGGGVMDSKLLTDDRVRRLGPALQGRFAHAVEVLEPPEYNAEHARQKNLNPMLADLHARAIRRLAGPGDHVVIDRFAREELMQKRLADLGLRLEQFPRAERVLAVAAASIVARFVYVERMRELSEEYAVELHKGAGAPTDASVRRFVTLHGRSALGQVAKLHFKNTSKIPRGLGRET